MFNSDGTPFELFTGDDGADGDDGSSGINFLITIAESAIDDDTKTTTDGYPYEDTIVPIAFSNGNNASSITISFDGSDPIPVLLSGSPVSGSDLTLAEDGVALFYFDGISLHQLGIYN